MRLKNIIHECRHLPEAKRKTFDQAKAEIFKHLRDNGWTVKTDLKVPHATSRDGRFRLWFKPQAVYMDYGGATGKASTDMGAARSMHTDIRDVDGPGFLKDVERWEKIIQQYKDKFGD